MGDEDDDGSIEEDEVQVQASMLQQEATEITIPLPSPPEPHSGMTVQQNLDLMKQGQEAQEEVCVSNFLSITSF